MQSKATTVAQYLKELPADRRAAIEQVRAVVLKNLPKGYEEGMQYGMIGYFVPHSLYPAGYHCDPKQPLPFMSIASQKNHMAIYMCSIYMEPDSAIWLQQQWAKEVEKGNAKRLDMGKSCIRFKKIEDIPLNVIGAAVKRAPVKQVIASYENNLAMYGSKRASKKKTSKKAPATRKTNTKKVAKKTVTKKSTTRKVTKKTTTKKSTTKRATTKKR
ncbi:MAG: DUF1801 domain-containing protein [Phycisphaeraceae bacterium]|nr:DUF1801 domain-containing protein [Phycisphaerales bacterium]MCB9860918.1 DUF1801 domain-containing protein [Phycisphaeraceae bacterium]